MKIMINISQDTYKSIKHGIRFKDDVEAIMTQIENGTPLPKGQWVSELVYGEDWKGCKQQYYQPISCSKCHLPNHYKSAYCPNCGAKMEEEE